MKQSIQSFLRKKTFMDILVNGYIVISVLNVFCLFSNKLTCEMMYILFGNHSVLYPYFGLLIAADMQMGWLAMLMFFYWIVSFVWLLASYLIYLKWKKILPFQLAVICDSLFVCIFVVMNIQYGGFLDVHVAMCIGVLLNIVFAIYIQWHRCSQSKKQYL